MTTTQTPLRAATCTVLLFIAASAHAQTQKPGLWESTTQMQSGGQDTGAAMAQMQKQLESMPPEQRKMMQDMMAKQGMQLEGGAGGGIKMKICLTPEMAERNQVAPPSQYCTYTTNPRVGNTMRFSFVCTKPPSQGQGEVTFNGDTAYATKMTATSSVNGKERAMDMQSSAKWLASDCGDIKPFKVPGKP